MKQYQDCDTIKCWACDVEVACGALRDADGFCPHCDVLIDLNEPPYQDYSKQTYPNTEESENG